MYTKTQFDRLKRTRKPTGKQVGRALIQYGIQYLNDAKTVGTLDDIIPLVNSLTDMDDVEEYNMYANMYSGIIEVWNFTNAVGNDAVANLAFIRSIISRFEDYSNAESSNQTLPVMITAKQYETYKEQLKEKRAEFKKQQLSKKITLAELFTDIDAQYPEYPYKGDTRTYSNAANKVIEEYKHKYLNVDEISFVRNVMQLGTNDDPVKAQNESLINYFHDFIESTSQQLNELSDYLDNHNSQSSNSKKMKQFYDTSISEVLRNTLIPQWYASKKPKRPYSDTDVKDALQKYIQLIHKEQLKIIYSKNISFNDALLAAIKEYPYKIIEHPHQSVPYVPEKLSYADLLFANEGTANIAQKFWYYASSKESQNNDNLNNFIQNHFQDFFKARKKDLVKKHPKLSSVLSKITNSTSFIIPYITYETLATAGIIEFKELVSDDYVNDNVRFIDMLTKQEQEQARIFGYAVVHGNSDAQSMHYDIKNYILDTLKRNEATLNKSFAAIRHYAAVQLTYEDYIKGVARIANDRSYRDYNKTTSYNTFIADIKSYRQDIYNLLALINDIIPSQKDKLILSSAIKEHLPLDIFKPKEYKHKTIKDIAKILESSYNSSTPNNAMAVIGSISEGVDW